jgi:hypothetical protein
MHRRSASQGRAADPPGGSLRRPRRGLLLLLLAPLAGCSPERTAVSPPAWYRPTPRDPAEPRIVVPVETFRAKRPGGEQGSGVPPR